MEKSSVLPLGHNRKREAMAACKRWVLCVCEEKNKVVVNSCEKRRCIEQDYEYRHYECRLVFVYLYILRTVLRLHLLRIPGPTISTTLSTLVSKRRNWLTRAPRASANAHLPRNTSTRHRYCCCCCRHYLFPYFPYSTGFPSSQMDAIVPTYESTEHVWTHWQPISEVSHHCPTFARPREYL
jgi:hypothetical protein